LNDPSAPPPAPPPPGAPPPSSAPPSAPPTPTLWEQLVGFVEDLL
jgi:hypothetical protein